MRAGGIFSPRCALTLVARHAHGSAHAASCSVVLLAFDELDLVMWTVQCLMRITIVTMICFYGTFADVGRI